MRIVGGLDIHRRQITFDYLDERSGQSRRGRIAPSDRMLLRRWLEANIDGAPAAVAVEACTGWRFVVEELQRAGIEAHLGEPADTAAARGPKRRVKTDRTDARHLRELLATGRLPESWIPPQQVLEMRARLQLFLDLRGEHTPGCSASTPSCCTTAPRRSPGTCSGWTTAADCRPLTSCLPPAGKRSPRRCGCWMRWTLNSLRCAGRSPRSPAASPAARRC